jgi:hypothetical protein
VAWGWRECKARKVKERRKLRIVGLQTSMELKFRQPGRYHAAISGNGGIASSWRPKRKVQRLQGEAQELARQQAQIA